MQPRITFGVLKNNQKIQEAYLKGGINTGIGYKQYHKQVVPLFEEHDTRVRAGYKLSEWAALSPEERAFEVALRRLIRMVDNHTEAEIAKEMNRKTPPRRRR
jgi:hypothetical protein